MSGCATHRLSLHRVFLGITVKGTTQRGCCPHPSLVVQFYAVLNRFYFGVTSMTVCYRIQIFTTARNADCKISGYIVAAALMRCNSIR